MKHNADHKVCADLHRRLRTFNVSDYVMVRLSPEQFPPGNREEIARAKHKTFSNLQEDQFKCLCGGPPTGFWH